METIRYDVYLAVTTALVEHNFVHTPATRANGLAGSLRAMAESASRMCAPVLLAALSGCAALVPTGLRTEVSHDSHATAGSAHCTEHCAEDGLTRASVLLQWRPADGLLIEAGEGLNLHGRNGGGFYGPAEVFTGRVSYTVDFGR